MSTPLQPQQYTPHMPEQESRAGAPPMKGPAGLGRIVEVDADDIDFSQHHIDEAKVESMARKKKAGAQMPLPMASMAGGKVRIQDGHHRIAADMKLGKRRLQVRVF